SVGQVLLKDDLIRIDLKNDSIVELHSFITEEGTIVGCAQKRTVAFDRLVSSGNGYFIDQKSRGRLSLLASPHREPMVGKTIIERRRSGLFRFGTLFGDLLYPLRRKSLLRILRLAFRRLRRRLLRVYRGCKYERRR